MAMYIYITIAIFHSLLHKLVHKLGLNFLNFQFLNTDMPDETTMMHIPCKVVCLVQCHSWLNILQDDLGLRPYFQSTAVGRTPQVTKDFQAHYFYHNHTKTN